MKGVELYGRVRHAVRIEGLSERAAATVGLDPRTVSKMMKFSVPPGYMRKKPPAKPKLDAFIPMIDRISGTTSRDRRNSSIRRSGSSIGFGNVMDLAIGRGLVEQRKEIGSA
jgi:hypothetical protein